jgi:hypothetical protein
VLACTSNKGSRSESHTFPMKPCTARNGVCRAGPEKLLADFPCPFFHVIFLVLAGVARVDSRAIAPIVPASPDPIGGLDVPLDARAPVKKSA